MGFGFSKDLWLNRHLFFREPSSSKSFGLFLFQVIEAGQNSQQDMNRVIDRRMAEYPFGQALKKEAAQPEKNSHTYPPHGVRRSFPKEAQAHLEPPQPEQQEEKHARQAEFSGHEGEEPMGRRRLWPGHLTARGHITAQ